MTGVRGSFQVSHGGSTLYVVWTQNRQDSTSLGRFDLGTDTGDLLAAPSDDVLLVKFSYRFAK